MDKVALVTGVSSGIGRSAAELLRDAGYLVFGTTRSGKGAPDGIRAVQLDVRDPASVKAAVAAVAAHNGRIDVLVNNAGGALTGAIEETSIAEAQALFDVNFFGAARVTDEVLPLMRAARSGRVVFVSSVVGFLPAPYMGYYAASKHALEALAESQRHEFARSGTPIKVSLIEPGEIATAIWDKADTSTDDIERQLDDAGRRRYGWLLDQARGFIDEGREKGIPPSDVAAVVEQALTATKPKARYLVGRDAKLAGHLLTRLPDRLRDAANRLGSAAWEKRGRNLPDRPS